MPRLAPVMRAVLPPRLMSPPDVGRCPIESGTRREYAQLPLVGDRAPRTGCSRISASPVLLLPHGRVQAPPTRDEQRPTSGGGRLAVVRADPPAGSRVAR